MSKEQRGKDAAQLLENYVLRAAFEELEMEYVKRWRTSPDDDKGWDTRHEAYTMLRALDAFKAQLASFVIDGKLAETKLNRREE